MRRLYLLATLCLMLAACSKQARQEDAGISIPKIFSVGCDTKTALDGKSVKWSTGDKITIYSADGQTAIYSVPKEDNGKSTIDISVTVGEAPYYALAFREKTSASFEKSTGALSVNAFSSVDGSWSSADMLATSSETQTLLFEHINGWLHFQTERTLQKVTLTASGKCFGPEVITFASAGGAMTVSGGDTSSATFACTLKDCYFPLIPGTYGNVSVKYNAAEGEYSIDLPGITINSGKVIELGNMDSRMTKKPGVDKDCYVKMTTAPEDWSGKYLMVGYNSKGTPKAINDWYTNTTGYAMQTTAVTETNSIIDLTETTQAWEFTVEKATATGYTDCYTFKFKGEYVNEYTTNWYFKRVADINNLDEYAYWKLSMDNNGVVSPLNKKQGTRVFQYYEAREGSGEIRALAPPTYPASLYFFKFTKKGE